MGQPLTDRGAAAPAARSGDRRRPGPRQVDAAAQTASRSPAPRPTSPSRPEPTRSSWSSVLEADGRGRGCGVSGGDAATTALGPRRSGGRHGRRGDAPPTPRPTTARPDPDASPSSASRGPRPSRRATRPAGGSTPRSAARWRPAPIAIYAADAGDDRQRFELELPMTARRRPAIAWMLALALLVDARRADRRRGAALGRRRSTAARSRVVGRGRPRARSPAASPTARRAHARRASAPTCPDLPRPARDRRSASSADSAAIWPAAAPEPAAARRAGPPAWPTPTSAWWCWRSAAPAGRFDVDKTLDHELAHLALGAAVPGAPRWLHEGFAWQHAADLDCGADRDAGRHGVVRLGDPARSARVRRSRPPRLPASRAYAQSYDLGRATWPTAAATPIATTTATATRSRTSCYELGRGKSIDDAARHRVRRRPRTSCSPSGRPT
jgi:hypothetical protein